MTGPLFFFGSSTAFLLGALLPLTGATHPSSVEFGGQTYEVRYNGDDGHIVLTEHGEDARDLGYGQQLLHYDLDGDGTLDLGVYNDERDGFRHTFAYLDIWTNDGRTLAAATPESAKWKDGHWAWIDVSKYPALDGRTLWGWWFEQFMHAQDDQHDGWF